MLAMPYILMGLNALERFLRQKFALWGVRMSGPSLAQRLLTLALSYTIFCQKPSGRPSRTCWRLGTHLASAPLSGGRGGEQ
jgi:hypothetical protein